MCHDGVILLNYHYCMNSSESLFTAEPFLEHRLKTGIFDFVPQSPGVYRFYDGFGHLLYVGKAKNLRSRLFSYKRIKPGSVSRKVSKMIGQTVSFDYLVTETERDAFLLENRLIRLERPPFNHVNKETETYYYVYLKSDGGGLEFRLAMRIHDDSDHEFWHGCFKGHAPVRKSFGCLLRLLWMAENDVHNPMHLPFQLTRNLTPMRFYLPWKMNGPESCGGLLQELLDAWMRGESCEILDWFVVQIEGGIKRTPFQILFLEHHLECLKYFFDHKLTRHREIRGERKIINQDEVDDLLIA
ncbi:MAG: nucleotide excision repair endonuclease [Balneolaceae bacterium]|nr:MAG: nucleotide excision repair endonuclease [Balneolaceae bacterium]